MTYMGYNMIGNATVLKQVDKLDSKSSAERRAGSNPASGTILGQ